MNRAKLSQPKPQQNTAEAIFRRKEEEYAMGYWIINGKQLPVNLFVGSCPVRHLPAGVGVLLHQTGQCFIGMQWNEGGGGRG